MDPSYKPIAVGHLRFDPENPRIPPGVDGNDDQAVLDWMLEDAGLVELMGSIAEKGYFPAEPLLVTEIADDEFIVLEGNRRLAAILLILNPERAPRRKSAVAAMAVMADKTRLSELPCAIFDNRGDVLDYLGYRHITGVKQWEPAAKARYLDSLYREHLDSTGSEVYRYIARLIGSRADYVSRLLGALRLFELIFHEGGAQPVEESDASFSLLTLALNYSNVVAYLGLSDLTQESFTDVDREHLGNLANWLYREDPDLDRTQLGDSRNMKLLAAALGHPEGVAALERGEIAEDAARATVNPSELLLRALRDARARLSAAQNLVHRARVDTLVSDLLEELEELVAQVSLLARRKRRKDEADVD